MTERAADSVRSILQLLKRVEEETPPTLRGHRQRIIDLRSEGHTYRAIGEALGISTERARQLYYDGLGRMHVRANRIMGKIAPHDWMTEYRYARWIERLDRKRRNPRR